jgi:multidrug efflux pump subunit AcrB
MIDWFVDYALRKRLVVATVCVFVSIYGYYSWTQLSVEAYPDIADTSSQVITQAPGMAAEEVEQRITIPLERELNGTPGLLFMRSKSTFGLSLITLVFRELLVPSAHQRAHPECHVTARHCGGSRPGDVTDRSNLLLHARIRHQGSA